MTVESLLRPEIRGLKPYVTARQETATVRLNANELPWPSRDAQAGTPLNRYPAIRPATLQAALAGLYGVPAERLLVTRGSSEAIDLLVRAFCRAGRDSILVMPPTFAMYRVYADIQGARTLEATPDPGRDFRPDAGAALDRCEPDTKLIFVCSPNNPTGQAMPQADIVELARMRAGRSVIVVDEAYTEFNDQGSITGTVAGLDNVVVLRTLSKALGLAGARCGAVIGDPVLLGWLNGMLAPYAFATPVVERVLDALSPGNLAQARNAVARVVRERERMAAALAGLPAVDRVWPSRSNFLLTRFRDGPAVMRALASRRILVRDFPQEPLLAGCARITIGTPRENELLLDALRADRRESGNG